jgi:methionine-rich copper-binding protein CopC
MSILKTFCLSGILLLTLNYAGIVNAHAVVTDDSLKVEAVLPNTPTQVKLTFNAGIELGLSNIFLVRTGDIEERLNMHNGNKPGLVLVDIPALQAGEYALHYKILAADGHLTEDVIRFTVKP